LQASANEAGNGNSPVRGPSISQLWLTEGTNAGGRRRRNSFGSSPLIPSTLALDPDLRSYRRLTITEWPSQGNPIRWGLPSGPEELRRLNVIVTLKAFGMTLAQIRTLLETKSPPLARALRMQLQACRARRDTADKAVGLVKTALAAIESGKQLSLDDLCNLTRSTEMENEHTRAQARAQFVRELERAKIAQAHSQFVGLLERAKRARKKRGDDDGAAELIPTGPPKKPRGGSPAFATRPADGNELTPSVNKVPTV
jgi:DNA-binding transcriptional MerR regulator